MVEKEVELKYKDCTKCQKNIVKFHKELYCDYVCEDCIEQDIQKISCKILSIKIYDEMSYEDFRCKNSENERIKNLIDLYKSIVDNVITKELNYKLQKNYIRYKFIYDKLNINSIEEFLFYLKMDITRCIMLEKDPSKQSMDEKLQVIFYNEKYGKNIKRVPHAKSFCFLTEDDTISIVKPSGSQNFGKRTKSFDAIDDKCFYILKHVGEAGGAQDNQVADVVKMLETSKKFLTRNKTFDKKFTAILSGKYMGKHLSELIKKFKDEKIDIVFLD